MHWVIASILGIIAGVLSGLFGVGGGTVLVPLFLYVLKMDIHTATGTSLAVIIPTAIFGTLFQGSAGQVNWKIAVIVGVLAVLGSYAGVKLNVLLPPQHLQKLFAIFLFIIAIQLFFFQSK